MKPLLAVTLIGIALTACAPPASRGSLRSDNPASKLYAISRAGQQRDMSAVPALVEELESDDPAVRMMAIMALEEITGTRLGYNPYASPAERAPAVKAWVAAVRDGQFGQPESVTPEQVMR